MFEPVRNIYPKNIPTKFQKDLKKYFPGYRANKLGDMDGQADRQAD